MNKPKQITMNNKQPSAKDKKIGFEEGLAILVVFGIIIDILNNKELK